MVIFGLVLRVVVNMDLQDEERNYITGEHDVDRNMNYQAEERIGSSNVDDNMEDYQGKGGSQSNIDNNMKYQDEVGVSSNVDNNMKYQDKVSNVDNNMKYQDKVGGRSNVDNNTKYQAEDNHGITPRSTKPTTRESQNTKRDLRAIEMERKIEKSLKIKEATAKQELEAEKHSGRHHKYVPSGESSRQRRAYPIGEGEASGGQEEAKVKDEEISASFRNAKLDYFQKKKAHNDSIMNSIKKTVSENESEKRKEISKKKILLYSRRMLRHIAWNSSEDRKKMQRNKQS